MLMPACPHELASDGAPCAWAVRLDQAQNELVLAKYEAKKWKEKYLQEKKRRRKLARSLVEAMATAEEAKKGVSGPHRRPSSAARTRRSSSALSDKDQIETLLSPTLSSFDFDDDDDDDGDEEDDVVSTDGSAGGTEAAEDGDHVTRLTPRRRDSRSKGDVRPVRSSTLGSYDVQRVTRSNSWRRDGNASLPPQSTLLYRMLYTKSSSRDLWSTQSSKFQSIARSVVFSMQLKKEHVFEHFFVTGLAGHRDLGADGDDDVTGFWKPQVLYEFAKRPGRAPESSVAEFCFPVGVPVVKCKPHQAAALRGSPVTIWSSDVEQLQKHVLDPFKTSGYTFRLTGAKGEVLHGFCVAVMRDLKPTPTKFNASRPTSPKGDWSKRASYPNVAGLRLTESVVETNGATTLSHAEHGELDQPTSDTDYLAPLCYCFTSKFPFYKLHFSLIREIIENELRGAQQPEPTDMYEITLTVESELGVEFAVCRQPNTLALPATDKTNGARSGRRGAQGVASLNSVSSGFHRDSHGIASLSEENPSTTHAAVDRRIIDDQASAKLIPIPLMKRSFSTDDIADYTASASCVVEKPVVVRTDHAVSPRVAQNVHVGDVLESIDGIATSSVTFVEAMDLIKTTPRPAKLRFRRLKSRTELPQSPRRAPADIDAFRLSNASTDILQRVRRMRLEDPGAWSALRLPQYQLSYQLPKRDAERWSVGVVLRTLKPEHMVKLVTFLLLERQVVIMGRNSAHVAATCTAFLLLLAPYQWQSTYIPQLPASLLDFLHSPVPFLVGCQPLDCTDEWSDVCFFDIDNGFILAPIADHHITPTYIPHGNELNRLFEGAAQRYRRLRPTSKPWYELSDEEDKIITLTLQESQIFLKDICGALTTVSLTPTRGKSFYELLQDEIATIVRKSNFEDFLEEFSQTQLFCQYCEATLKPDTDGSVSPPPRASM